MAGIGGTVAAPVKKGTRGIGAGGGVGGGGFALNAGPLASTPMPGVTGVKASRGGLNTGTTTGVFGTASPGGDPTIGHTTIGGSGAPGLPGVGPTYGPGGPGGGGMGGWSGGNPGGGMGIEPFNPLSIKAEPNPEMQASIEAWKKRMADMEAGYKDRMSSDTSQRAIDKATGAIRSQAAGMGMAADAAGAARGTGPGTGAAGIGDAAQMATAKAASDISLGREAQLDKLYLGGQEGMNSLYGSNPYESTAKLGLGQQELGLKAYLGQIDAQAKMAEAKAKMYGSPIDWYQMLMGMV